MAEENFVPANSEKSVPAGADFSEISEYSEFSENSEHSDNPVPAEPIVPADFVPAKSNNWIASFFELNLLETILMVSYYNVRVVLPIYIAQADNVGGLHLTPSARGTIYAWWALVGGVLPIVTGGFGDRYGFKNVMGISMFGMIFAYLLFAFCRDLPALDAIAGTFGIFDGSGDFLGIMIAVTVFAIFNAFFRPSIHGALSHALPRDKSSVGWGVFYWICNVGALVAHYIPVIILGGGLFAGTLGEANSVERWRAVFCLSAAMMAVSLIPLWLYKDCSTGAPKTLGVLKILGNALREIVQPRLLTWILIMSGFWTMMYQLWDLQPNFIEDWVSSANVAAFVNAAFPQGFANLIIENHNGVLRVPQAVLISMNSAFIVVGVVFASWITRRMRTLDVLIFGMIAATAGIVIAGYTQNAWFFILGVLFFSCGEMFTGPKVSQYLSDIAPNDKKGTYLAYSGIPLSLGIFLGSKLAGMIYGAFGEKATLALRFLAGEKSISFGWLFENAADLEAKTGIARDQAVPALCEQLGCVPADATNLLWQTYSPNLMVWLPFAAIGILSTAALFIFSRFAKRWKDMNA